MSRWIDHLMILPVLAPMVAAAVLLLIDERRHRLKAAISVMTVVGCLVVALLLLRLPGTPAAGLAVPRSLVYRLGDWPAPFGIVLVLDRLSALMLVLTSTLAIATLVFSLANWGRAGSHFHSLFLLLVMGLNGAFLTGDLFNLFVFFEILLAASYGLVLHGSGRARVRAGLHYIAVNLVASSLFLVGVSLVYGVVGTLNMADIALRVPTIADGDRMLFEAGAAILGVAFLVKAGMWPLGFWLPGAYSAAAPPIAALFAIMTKVGFYIVLRLSLLMFGPEAEGLTHFGGTWLIAGGIMTVIFGSIGILAAQDLARLASYCVVVSAGTLLTAVGIGDVALTGGALFYLVSSTLSIGAFFMLTELAQRGRAAGADVLAVTMEAYGGDNDDDMEDGPEAMGVAIPGTMAILGLSFTACALLIAGLPPLSGFVAKFLILRALLDSGDGMNAGSAIGGVAWMFMAILLLSGFAAVIAMARAGIRSFWLPLEGTVPRVRVLEMVPIVGLLLLCVLLTLQAGPVMSFIESIAQDLHAPAHYIGSVISPEFPPDATARRPVTHLLPFPLMSAFLLATWLLLNQSLSAGQIVLGSAIAIVGGWALSAVEPPKGKSRRPGRILDLALSVLADIFRSNVAVARIILGLATAARSGFVRIPLDMRSPYALVALAVIITATPGTVWVDYNSNERILTIHVLDLVDEGTWVRTVKHRYERHLLDIFG